MAFRRGNTCGRFRFPEQSLQDAVVHLMEYTVRTLDDQFAFVENKCIATDGVLFSPRNAHVREIRFPGAYSGRLFVTLETCHHESNFSGTVRVSIDYKSRELGETVGPVGRHRELGAGWIVLEKHLCGSLLEVFRDIYLFDALEGSVVLDSVGEESVVNV